MGLINIPTSADASVGTCGSIPPSTDFYLELKVTLDSSILVLGIGKSHQNTGAGKFDPERAFWNCWLLALFNDVAGYDVTTHAATLPATSPPFSIGVECHIFEQIHFKIQSISGTRKNNQLLVSDPEWQKSVSGDTMSHPSLGYALDWNLWHRITIDRDLSLWNRY